MTTVLWINELSSRALKIISSDKELRKVSYLKYIITSGKSSVILERYFRQGKLICKSENIKFQLGGKRNQNGQILLVKAEFMLGDLVCRIAENLWAREDLSHLWYNSISIPRVKNYLERCIEDEIKNIVYLSTYLIWLKDQNDTYEKRIILMVPLNPWGKEIQLYLNKLGLEIYLFEDKSDNFKSRSLQITKSLVYGSGSIILKILNNNNVEKSVSKNDNFSSKNKVSVTYNRSINPEDRNDLFWYDNSKFDPKSIIISLESPAKPFYKQDLKLLHSQGFSGIVHRNKNIDLTGTLPMWKNTKGLIILEISRIWFLMNKILFCWRYKKLFWQYIKLIELMRKVNELKAYYKSENIRLDIGLDSKKSSAIRAIAMDKLGGVRIGPQWSGIELKSSFLSKNDNIYFCWGKIEEQFFKKARSCIDTLIISGYIYDKYIEYKRPLAKKLRKQLTLNGAQFVVTLFDTRITNDYALVEDMEYFYQLFLNELINDQTFRLIIKSKDTDIFNKFKNIKPLINNAINTGRCIVLEEKSIVRRNLWHINNIFTFLPAMASDLSVSFSISTSGTESALAGARAVYYDHMNQPDHPYYMDGSKNRLVFDELKELIMAIRRYRAGELPDLGDHSPILDEIDPFRDGKAGERIGTYIKWFMDKLNAGSDRKEAINWSNAQYAAKWGADKIIKLN